MKYWLLFLPLLLVACSPSSSENNQAPPPPPPPAPADSTSTTSPAATALDEAMLENYHWKLTSATNGSGQRIGTFFVDDHKPLQLDFSDGRVYTSNTCNHISGRYRIEEGYLETGPMIQTMMACTNDSLMALDKAAKNFLRADPRIHLQSGSGAPQLTLTGSGGSTLVFSGQPTAEMRYGSKGETIFLEVAAQTVPCSESSASGEQCLRVRERHYGANGLEKGNAGPWKTLHRTIKGYTHTPGVRNVLRLKRYKVSDAQAGKPSVVYVLDMVVESEIVKP